MIIVYTAIFDSYDTLQIPVYNALEGVEYVCCTNTMQSLPHPWKRLFIRPRLSALFESRRCKALSHQLFPGVEATIWHGGNVQLIENPVGMLRYVEDVDIAVNGHPRDTIYEEASACAIMEKDCPRIIRRQANAYCEDECPGKMYGAFLIIRKHTPDIIRFNELWWDQTRQYSYRDQISLGYALWKCDILPNVIRGTHRNGPDYKRFPHNCTS